MGQTEQPPDRNTIFTKIITTWLSIRVIAEKKYNTPLELHMLVTVKGLDPANVGIDYNYRVDLNPIEFGRLSHEEWLYRRNREIVGVLTGLFPDKLDLDGSDYTDFSHNLNRLQNNLPLSGFDKTGV